MASNTAALLYMRMDIIMLREMKGDAAAGLYAAATVISEAGYFLPVVIVASAFPIILKYQREDKASYLFSIRKLYRTLILLAVAVALPLSLFSSPIIDLLYGHSYGGSKCVLLIHLWACLPMFLSLVSSHHLLAESMHRIILCRTSIGAALNLMLNLALIPGFGPPGAAAATVMTHLLILFSLGFFKETRAHFHLLATSLGIGAGSPIP
jgi:O-antigen/teichoic acid export membrane protein